MDKEEEDLEATLLAGDVKAAPQATAGSTYTLICALLASLTSIIYGYSKRSLATVVSFLIHAWMNS